MTSCRGWVRCCSRKRRHDDRRQCEIKNAPGSERARKEVRAVRAGAGFRARASTRGSRYPRRGKQCRESASMRSSTAISSTTTTKTTTTTTRTSSLIPFPLISTGSTELLLVYCRFVRHISTSRRDVKRRWTSRTGRQTEYLIVPKINVS